MIKAGMGFANRQFNKVADQVGRIGGTEGMGTTAIRNRGRRRSAWAGGGALTLGAVNSMRGPSSGRSGAPPPHSTGGFA